MENRALALAELRQIAQKMRASNLDSIELNGSAWRVRIKCAPQFRPLMPDNLVQTTPDVPPVSLSAPMPGIVLLQHPLNGLPLTKTGDAVEKSALLGMLKVGAVYLPLRSPVGGVITAIQVQQGEVVEYGTEIFVLRDSEITV
ncbi:acetyl-CoA carboxylase biotin carboxyl carrier protein subunit [Pantoea sp. CCBC3-3-1]|uniref:acetyl-CoA carboxylase biotin carboxyl carrier protein n=1 Tax=Pantoea sp. CCBC3-3-1 TaxID=2490851 RepID=UPI0011BE6421|nr:acetyl-CoA carboxylase biotin carboxyl carrier protein subunit [Pantoea sp. CCBC3-3-1]